MIISKHQRAVLIRLSISCSSQFRLHSSKHVKRSKLCKSSRQAARLQHSPRSRQQHTCSNSSHRRQALKPSRQHSRLPLGRLKPQTRQPRLLRSSSSFSRWDAQYHSALFWASMQQQGPDHLRHGCCSIQAYEHCRQQQLMHRTTADWAVPLYTCSRIVLTVCMALHMKTAALFTCSDWPSAAGDAVTCTATGSKVMCNCVQWDQQGEQ